MYYAEFFPTLAKSHSLLHNGHTERVLNHLLMQQKWKAWLQTPQATLQA